MARDKSVTIWRPVAVWMIVSAGVVAVTCAVPGAWRGARAESAYDRVETMLVAGCTTGLALALTWLWLVTTLTAVELLVGTTHSRGGATRRLVLLACGAAVVAGTSLPAAASGGDGRDLLVGLHLPERAVAPAHRQRTHLSARLAQQQAAPRATHVVRTGDSLWSIALAHPADSTSVDERWRAIWMANRDVVGDDPDLIVPGQVLRLPANPTPHDPNSDGDR